MAHHPSPSPSGSSSTRRRRLSEVLGEQQEPFSLDVYLLERGCSPAFLDATACGSGGAGACSTCWPIKTRGTGGRRTPLRRRRPARSKKQGSRRSGVLTMLLSKILSGTTTAAPPTAVATKQNRPRQRASAIGWRRVVVADEKQSTLPADRFALAVPSASPTAGAGAGAVEAHMEDDEDEDDDESSKKQLSPVSVLEQSLFEHSPPPPPHSPKAMAIFSELLEAAYTPNTLLEDLLAIAKDQSSSTQSKDGGGRRRSITDDSSSTPPMPTPPRARRRRRRKKKHVAVEKDIGPLASEDLLRPSVEDVGAAIAAAVLEALTEETAAELMMGMDRG